MRLFPLDPTDPAIVPSLTRLWNATCGRTLPISERFVRYNLESATGGEVAGCVVKRNGQPAGFTFTSAVTRPVNEIDPFSGWIDILVVSPDFQGQGVGSRLLDWAEDWLSERSRTTARLGGGLHPYAPGLPVKLDSVAFFLNRGYAPRTEFSHVIDVARCLGDYATPNFVKDSPVEIRPLLMQEAAALDAFLSREFPGRWHFEFQEHLRQNGRLSDYLAMWIDAEIQGFCQVTVEDSIRPMDRFYLHGLPHPWGHLGPIGISAVLRGQGLGASLLDAGLRYLQGLGVVGCVIDWVSEPAFYQKFGFQRYNEYLILTKKLV